MKRITLQIIVVFLTGLVFYSCDKPFEFNVDDADNLIVVNSFFNSTEPLSVTVTKSMAAQNSNTITELTNAKVRLYKDGNYVEDLVYKKLPNESIGRFFSNTVPVEGSNYKVEVGDADLTSVSTQSTLPKHVDLISDSAVWVKWFTDEDTAFVTRMLFDITINDPIGENYYYLTMSFPVYEVDTINNTRTFDSWQYGEILTSDLPNHELYIRNALLFKDSYFEGQTKKITGTVTSVSSPSGNNQNDSTFVVDRTKLRIELHSLSKEAFLYCSGYANKLRAQDDLYSEPIIIYSNVENGLGLFAGENISATDVVVKY